MVSIRSRSRSNNCCVRSAVLFWRRVGGRASGVWGVRAADGRALGPRPARLPLPARLLERHPPTGRRPVTSTTAKTISWTPCRVCSPIPSATPTHPDTTLLGVLRERDLQIICAHQDRQLRAAVSHEATSVASSPGQQALTRRVEFQHGDGFTTDQRTGSAAITPRDTHRYRPRARALQMAVG
jgi:hypothetical protein